MQARVQQRLDEAANPAARKRTGEFCQTTLEILGGSADGILKRGSRHVLFMSDWEAVVLHHLRVL